MSEQGSRTVIDSLEFARAGQRLSGSLPVTCLERLHDGLFDTGGRVAFVVQGGADALHRPTLALELTGELHLRCQRCLGRLDYPLRLANTLLLASESSAGGAVSEDESEAIEPSAELDIAELVEEEIILELPYAPRHAEGECPPGPDVSRPGGNSAFAKLAELKRDSK